MSTVCDQRAGYRTHWELAYARLEYDPDTIYITVTEYRDGRVFFDPDVYVWVWSSWLYEPVCIACGQWSSFPRGLMAATHPDIERELIKAGFYLAPRPVSPFVAFQQ